MAIQVVILAAGQGKRMRSHLPKVLHSLAGKPLLEHVIDTAQKISPDSPPIIVYGHQGDILKNALQHHNVCWVEQHEQLGTGHAVLQAMPHLADENGVVILYGDVPLISQHTLKKLIDAAENTFSILTTNLEHPHGYGRIKRDEHNNIVAIIEEKDANYAERKITEVNTGIYFIPAKLLKKWLPKLKNNNAQHEYYLTDVITQAVDENIMIHASHPESDDEIFGINDRLQLAHVERRYQKKLAEKLMLQGVTMIDPARVDIRGDVRIGQDVIIDINVILEGNVTIGNNCVIGPNTILRNTVIENNVEIKANSFIDGAEIADHVVIGPFARLRPGTILAANSHVGNFVEIKNSFIGANTKVNHLSYVGDSEVGVSVNIGAGTITCNYDGINKHKTIIGDNAFIGSCTQLVAPVTVGEGATIGAGSTITRDAPAHKLTLSRVPQKTILDWQRPVKDKKSET